MIDLVRDSVKELAMNPPNTGRSIVARFSNLVTTHIREFVGVRYRLPFHALGFGVFAAVFRLRQHFNVLGAVIPTASVLVVDALPTDGIKPVFSDGEEPVGIDSIFPVTPLLASLIGRGRECNRRSNSESVYLPVRSCLAATEFFADFVTAHAVLLVEDSKRVFASPRFLSRHTPSWHLCTINVSKQPTPH